MSASLRRALSLTLAGAAALMLAAPASAQSVQKPRHKTVAPAPKPVVPEPLAPGVELHTSTSASVGGENRYYSDTIRSGNYNSMGQNSRYGVPDPLPNSTDLKFKF